MKLKETDFYLDRPSVLGWRGVSLLVPAVASAVGFFAFAVLGFGFTELGALPQWFRTGLVLVGAFALALGGEIGTLSNTVEIFRKHGRQTVWDWGSLAISVLATLAGFLLAFSALLGARARWADWLQLYGPVLLGMLAALDSYGGFVEFGLYLNSYDERMQVWRDQFEQWKRAEVDAQRRAVEQARAAALAAKAEPNTPSPAGFPYPIDQARALAQEKAELTKEERKDQVIALFSQDPGRPIAQAARELGMSKTTLYTYLGELEQAGRARRNGHGVEMIG